MGQRDAIDVDLRTCTRTAPLETTLVDPLAANLSDRLQDPIADPLPREPLEAKVEAPAEAETEAPENVAKLEPVVEAEDEAVADVADKVRDARQTADSDDPDPRDNPTRAPTPRLDPLATCPREPCLCLAQGIPPARCPYGDAP